MTAATASAVAPAEAKPQATPQALPATFTGMKPPAPREAIQRVRYSHEAMAEMIIQNPWISQAELARNFGYTEGWVSQVIASTAFQSYLEERKGELIDPAIRATIDERFKGLVARSIEILMRKLEAPAAQISDELAIKALEVASKAAGYGAKTQQIGQQNNFVVQVPAKAASSEAWARDNNAGGERVVGSPVSQTSGKSVEDAVLVAPVSAGSSTAEMLQELKAK